MLLAEGPSGEDYLAYAQLPSLLALNTWECAFQESARSGHLKCMSDGVDYEAESWEAVCWLCL